MKQIFCPICGKWFRSLGYARHRTMHYEAKLREKAQTIIKEQESMPKDIQKIIDENFTNLI